MKDIEECILENEPVEGSLPKSRRVLAEDTVALEEIAWEENEDGSITICKYRGNAQKMKIPEMIEGKQGIAVCVRSIGGLAFGHCTSLTQLKLPASMRSIGDLAFEGCKNLVKIGIPASVGYIGIAAFGRCSHLKKITADQNNASYETDDMGVLYNKGKTTLICCPAGKTEINILSGVSDIESYAFFGCGSLVRIELPASIKSIGDSAFRDCTSLVQIELPDSVRSIGDLTFCCCTSLTQIKLPASVKSIGDLAFEGCKKLEEIVVDQNNPSYETDDAGVLYTKGKTTLICCPARKTELSIPIDVSVIERGAFESCKNLKDIYYAGSREQWDAIDFHERYMSELAIIHYGYRG